VWRIAPQPNFPEDKLLFTFLFRYKTNVYTGIWDHNSPCGVGVYGLCPVYVQKKASAGPAWLQLQVSLPPLFLMGLKLCTRLFEDKAFLPIERS
jgi:hypothetical protein